MLSRNLRSSSSPDPRRRRKETQQLCGDATTYLGSALFAMQHLFLCPGTPPFASDPGKAPPQWSRLSSRKEPTQPLRTMLATARYVSLCLCHSFYLCLVCRVYTGACTVQVESGVSFILGWLEQSSRVLCGIRGWTSRFAYWRN